MVSSKLTQNFVIAVLSLSVGAALTSQVQAQLTPRSLLISDAINNGLWELDVDTGQACFLAGVSSATAIATDSLDRVYFGTQLGSVRQLLLPSGEVETLAHGNLIEEPRDALMARDGKILFADRWGGTTGSGAILRIDPDTGAQEELASIILPRALTRDDNGKLLTIARGGLNDVWRVDPNSLETELLFRAEDLDNPTGIAFGPDGDLYVANVRYLSAINRHESEIVRLDLETGVQEYVSQPSEFRFIDDIVFDPNGQLLFGDLDGGFEGPPPPPLPCSKVYRLDPVTGESTVLWEPDDDTFYPLDLFLVPIPEPAMLLPLSFAVVLLLRRRR